MARFEELFRMRADANEAEVIEQFFTERGIDFTIRPDGSDAHEYGVLNGKNSAPKDTIIARMDVLPYDEEVGKLPIKVTLSNGSFRVIDIDPKECRVNVGTSPQASVPTSDVINNGVGTSATEDMEAYEFNTSIVNDFIQFLKPYNLDVKAQEIVLNSITSALDHCEEIRAGKANLPETTTFSINFDKNPT